MCRARTAGGSLADILPATFVIGLTVRPFVCNSLMEFVAKMEVSEYINASCLASRVRPIAAGTNPAARPVKFTRDSMLGRHQYGVDSVNDAVARSDIGQRDIGAVNRDLVTCHLD